MRDGMLVCEAMETGVPRVKSSRAAVNWRGTQVAMTELEVWVTAAHGVARLKRSDLLEELG